MKKAAGEPSGPKRTRTNEGSLGGFFGLMVKIGHIFFGLLLYNQ